VAALATIEMGTNGGPKGSGEDAEQAALDLEADEAGETPAAKKGASKKPTPIRGPIRGRGKSARAAAPPAPQAKAPATKKPVVKAKPAPSAKKAAAKPSPKASPKKPKR
jgi:hypothetical protein